MVKLYNTEGKVVGERELNPAVFGVTVKPALIHEVVTGIMAAARRPYAHTKTKGEVRGGGKKPWKQKGTGRARQGSIRSPQWAGGGIVFGPRSERDYVKKINRKAKRQALCMTLSDKTANERLVLVESLASDGGKTKATVALLKRLPVKGKIALLAAGSDALLSRSVHNLPDIRLSQVGNVSVLDVLRAEYVVTTPEAAERLEKLCAASAKGGKKGE